MHILSNEKIKKLSNSLLDIMRLEDITFSFVYHGFNRVFNINESATITIYEPRSEMSPFLVDWYYIYKQNTVILIIFRVYLYI